MTLATLAAIQQRLGELHEDELETVLDFVTRLIRRPADDSARQTALASEALLRREWDTPEEDEAWASL